MPTLPPSTTSQSEPDQIQLERMLDQLHEELKKNDVEPEALAVALLDAKEMIIGEVFEHDVYMESGIEGHGSFFEKGRFVTFKNPKRYTRLLLLAPNGEQNVSITISDFDNIDAGAIEVRPMGFFFLDWLNTVSQINYCRTYLNWFDGKRRAMAKAAGIEIASPTSLQDLVRSGRRNG